MDTNVVLDWLVFQNPVVVALLGPALASGRWHWHATSAMRVELENVLVHPEVARWQVDRVDVFAEFLRWATVLPAPVAPLSSPLRCSDPSDQMFIDLAVQLSGATLLSRDRAVLKLARRARAQGVSILTPERWSP